MGVEAVPQGVSILRKFLSGSIPEAFAYPESGAEALSSFDSACCFEAQGEAQGRSLYYLMAGLAGAWRYYFVLVGTLISVFLKSVILTKYFG